jgi:hypothetical protein
MRNILKSSVLALTALSVGIAVAAAAGAEPVLGSWQLNVSKSTFTAGPAVKSQTRTYSQSGQSIAVVLKSVGADGKESTTRTTYQFDGKDYPVTGNPDYDSLTARQVDANTAEFVVKRGGKPVGTTDRAVSKDGKTLTAKTTLTGANGQKTENVLVFDKQ